MPGLVLQAYPKADTSRTDRTGIDTGQDLSSSEDQPPEDMQDAGGGNDARIGFTASRKVGNAVARNRAKRRLRALSAEVMTQHAMPGRDYVLIARQTTPNRDYNALRGDLERALKRLKLWR